MTKQTNTFVNNNKLVNIRTWLCGYNYIIFIDLEFNLADVGETNLLQFLCVYTVVRQGECDSNYPTAGPWIGTGCCY